MAGQAGASQAASGRAVLCRVVRPADAWPTLSMLLPLLLLVAAATAQIEQRDDTLTLNASSAFHRIPACVGAVAKQWKLKSPSPKGLPATPCGRNDLKRGDICSLLAASPVEIPSALMRNARVHPDRYHALLNHLIPQRGANIVEVGTLHGRFANWLVREFRPANLTVMDISLRAVGECRDGQASTRAFAK